MSKVTAAVPRLSDIRAALDASRLDEARCLLDAAIADSPDSPQMQELLCECLRRQGRPAEALAACEKASRLAPGRFNAWLETGRTLNNLGRLSEAREALTTARDLAPENARVQHDLAHVSRRLGDMQAAREGFQAATRLQPDWASAWYRLGLLEHEAGDFGTAERCLRRAVEIEPSNAGALTALGAVLHQLGRPSEAIESYRLALDVAPGHAEAWGNLGISLQEEHRIPEAIEAYRKALGLRPDDYQAGAHLGDALLEGGEVGEALNASAELLRRFPGHSGALATRSIALLRSGDVEGYRDLADLERLILAVDVPVPAGFADLDAFNSALVRHVQAHESLRFQPSGHATRHGHHTGNLLRYEKGPVAALESAVGEAFLAYEALLHDLGDHTLATVRPPAWRMSMWSVIMGSQGYQLPHIHPTAWLSGVYYARVPRVVSDHDENQAGWIEFGRPPEALAGDTRFPVRRFAPREGLMFLFPGYLYHQTIPYESDELRVSLAFDLAPARPDGANIE